MFSILPKLAPLAKQAVKAGVKIAAKEGVKSAGTELMVNGMKGGLTLNFRR